MPNYIGIALEIARKAHVGQVDKAGVDYINHPETVASFVKSAEEKATAYLYDVLEDTKITVNDLKNARIPDNVIEAVQVLTKDRNTPYFDYLRQVKASPYARIVKLADLKHNSDFSRLLSITDKDLERLEKYKQATEFLEQ